MTDESPAPSRQPASTLAAQGFVPTQGARAVPGSSHAFRLMVATLTEDLFEGQVTYVDLPGLAGHVGALSRHTPLLALLAEGPLTVYPVEGAPSTLFVMGGIAEVGPWGVTVLADFAGHGMAAEKRRMDAARQHAAERRADQAKAHPGGRAAQVRARLDDELNLFLIRALRELRR